MAPGNRFGCSCLTSPYSCARETFQLGLFSSISFWCIVIVSTVRRITYCAWLVYYVQYTTVFKGFTLEDASHFIIAFGVGRAFACIVIAPTVQQVQVVSNYLWLVISLLLETTYYAIDPWLTSDWPITGNAFLFGIAFALTSILLDVVTAKIFGKKQLGNALGWTGFLAGLSLVLLLYFPGKCLC